MGTKKTNKLSDVYTPLEDGVVIEIFINENSNGVIIPEASQEKDYVCKVLAIGPQCKNIKMDDLVLIRSNCTLQIIDLVDPKNHLQCREFEILGIVDPSYKKIKEERAKVKAKEREQQTKQLLLPGNFTNTKDSN
jgi:co-chaperonin GroES (HSP10)